jgi:hypothetical protein
VKLTAELNMGICSRKNPELWPDRVILHHDNALVHDALRVNDRVTIYPGLGWTVLVFLCCPGFENFMTGEDFFNFRPIC